MSKTNIRVTTTVSAVCILLLAGCASAPPTELVDARTLYRRAEAGVARQWDPAQLHTAKKSLEEAERAFEEHGDGRRTRDLAYIAQRKAQRAEVQGQTAAIQVQLQQLESQRERGRVEQLAALRDDYAESRAELAEVQRARQEAELRERQASTDLARIASVKNEARGTVITISGSVLFGTGASELHAGAKAQLAQVAKTLTEQRPGAQIVVEGHTDTRGSEELNLDLSQRRAEAVRQFLVEQGVAADRIEAKGLGFARPIAPNKTATGRASNRRVEIVVEPTGPGRRGG